MAARRMFSIRVINSARFLRMPISCQALYFHLGMRADDDGVVEAYTVLKSVGATEDDLRVLVAKGFVQVLNEDLVSYITDWSENNTIRPDRKIDSIYKDLLVAVNPDIKLIEKKPRADQKKQMDNQWTSNGQPVDGIGKYSIEEVSIVKNNNIKHSRFVKPTVDEVREYCESRNNGIDAESFVAFYESKGWKVGKSPMKDWKAAVITWEKNKKKNSVAKGINGVAYDPNAEDDLGGVFG